MSGGITALRAGAVALYVVISYLFTADGVSIGDLWALTLIGAFFVAFIVAADWIARAERRSAERSRHPAPDAWWCGAVQPPPRPPFACTRDEGHAGPHETILNAGCGPLVARWKS